MSDASRQRLLRAVRLLPNAVRIGRGGLEQTDAQEEASASAAPREKKAESEDDAALKAAEAEIRKLKSELRDSESFLATERENARQAQAEMERIKAEAERERAEFAEKLESECALAKEAAAKEGYEEGSAKGYEDGIARAEQEKAREYADRFGAALALLDSISKSLQDSRSELVLTHVPQLVRLWNMLLERLLHAHVSVDEEVASRVLDAILKRVSDRERILIYLNSKDLAMIEANRETLIDQIRGVRSLEIMSDDHVDKGSCLVETNLGIYDARWKTQLEQISAEVEALVMESMIADG